MRIERKNLPGIVISWSIIGLVIGLVGWVVEAIIASVVMLIIGVLLLYLDRYNNQRRD